MIDLLIGELKRTWIQTRRYPAEVIGGVVILTTVFYGIFLSTQYMAGPTSGFGERLDAVVVGYVGAPRVFLARAIASLTLRLLLIAIVLGIIMATTGSRLAFPALLLLPLATLILSAYGLAFFIGSFALVLKKVQQVLGLFQFVLLFLLAAPTEDWTGSAKWAANMLPILPSTGLLRDLMARNQGLNWGVWAIALANGIFYFTLGILVFRWAERYAKQQGSLGGY
jgi:ABC-2 type transport system permease protein